MTIDFHEQRVRKMRFIAIAVSIVFIFSVFFCIYLVGAPHPAHQHLETAEISVVVEPARRVVSLAPSLTEIVFALGLNASESTEANGGSPQVRTGSAPRLVGRTRYCIRPASALTVPEVGGLGDPSIERLLSLHPDLILATPMTSPEVLEQLRTAGFCTLVLKHEGVEGVLHDIQVIGDSIGKATEAKQLVAAMRGRLKKISGGLKTLAPSASSTAFSEGTRRRPKVLFLYDPDGLYSAGPSSFASELVGLAGGDNLADKATSAWPQLSMEFILAGKPDVILVTGADDGTDPKAAASERLSMQNALLEKWRADPRWSELEAVRRGRVVVIPSSAFTVPGPHLVDGAEHISQALEQAQLH